MNNFLVFTSNMAALFSHADVKYMLAVRTLKVPISLFFLNGKMIHVVMAWERCFVLKYCWQSTICGHSGALFCRAGDVTENCGLFVDLWVMTVSRQY